MSSQIRGNVGGGSSSPILLTLLAVFLLFITVTLFSLNSLHILHDSGSSESLHKLVNNNLNSNKNNVITGSQILNT